MQFPTKDDITQSIVSNVIGEGKTIDDIPNNWVIKFLILGFREAIYMLVVVIKAVYDQFTALGATDSKLDEVGYEYGVDRKQATAAIHTVTLNKSSPVTATLQVPDNFLLTTTPVGNNPPIQFQVIPGQNLVIPIGSSSVSNVQVQCTQAGVIGNVPSSAINLVAQAGFDSVANSTLSTAGTDREDDDSYRARILDRKRNPERGGTPDDYKFWAESVQGVVFSTVFPRNRGPGTVDILITGPNGIPDQNLINTVQAYIDTKSPADIADGGVQVIAPTPVSVDITLSGCVWKDTAVNGVPLVQSAIEDYIKIQANKDRIVRVVDLIIVAKTVCSPFDPSKEPILIDFTMSSPVANIVLDNLQMAVPGTISVT
jgi:uncharacterized phage protein gp47/JayE